MKKKYLNITAYRESENSENINLIFVCSMHFAYYAIGFTSKIILIVIILQQPNLYVYNRFW